MLKKKKDKKRRGGKVERETFFCDKERERMRTGGPGLRRQV
jgi:hypothetical protein